MFLTPSWQKLAYYSSDEVIRVSAKFAWSLLLAQLLLFPFAKVHAGCDESLLGSPLPLPIQIKPPDRAVRELSMILGGQASVLSFDSFAKGNLPGIEVIRKKENIFVKYHGIVARVTANTQLEAKVLEKSQLLTNPHEVFTLRVYAEHGEEESGVFTDGTSGEIDVGVLYGEINRFIDVLGKKHGEISVKAIEIIHSHDDFDAGTASATIIHPVSVLDIQTATAVSKAMGIPIIITATVPNGYKYSTFILQDQNLTLEVAR